MPDPSYYDLLDIPPTADLDAIKRAYRRQIRATHPDQYEAERARLQGLGDQRRLRQLESQIEEAKKRTQRLNAAYHTLSDPVEREKYDRRQAQPGRASYTARPATGSNPYVYTQQRAESEPYAPPPPLTDERLPWLLLAIFMGVMLGFFSLLSTFLTAVESANVAANDVTAIGYTADELQSTTSARQGTRVARTQTALAPTPTPRSVADYIASAEAFFELGRYDYAIESYSSAIRLEPTTPAWYVRRAEAYLALAPAQPALRQPGLRDLELALALDASQVEAYRVRGLFWYALWQVNEDAEAARAALADLRVYDELTPGDEVVAGALARLAERTP